MVHAAALLLRDFKEIFESCNESGKELPLATGEDKVPVSLAEAANLRVDAAPVEVQSQAGSFFT